MKKYLFIPLLYASVSAQALTLTEGWDKVCAHSPEVRIYQEKYCESKGETWQASLLPNPDFSIDGNKSDKKSASGSRMVDMSFELSNTFEMGGKRAARVGFAKREEEVSYWEIEEVKRELLLHLIEHFIEVKVAEEKLSISYEQMNLAKKMYEVTREKVDAGKSPRFELTQSKLLFDRKQIEHAQAQNALFLSKRLLALLWGSCDEEIKEVSFPFYQLKEPHQMHVYEMALTEHPMFKRAEAEICAAKWERHANQTKGVPDLDLSVELEYKKDFEKSEVNFGLSFPLPIFDRNQGHVYKSQRSICRKQSARYATWLKLMEALRSTYTELKNALIKAKVFREYVDEHLSQDLDDVQEGFRQGKLHYFDVLETQEHYFEVQEEYIEALESYHKTMAELQVLITHPTSCLSFFIQKDPS